MIASSVHHEQEQAERQDDEGEAEQAEQRAEDQVHGREDQRDPQQPHEAAVHVDAGHDPRHGADDRGQHDQANRQTYDHD